MKRTSIVLLAAVAAALIACSTAPLEDTVAAGRRISFDSGWMFSLEGDGGFHEVMLPHDWSIEAPFDKDMEGGMAVGHKPGGNGHYHKEFFVPAGDEGLSKVLYFEGVYRNAEVSVNGTRLAVHPHGYTSFKVDFTSVCRYGDYNEVDVKVSNNGLNSRWYAGSGIYRHVWLMTLPENHLDEWEIAIDARPLDDGTASVTINAGGVPAEALKIVLRDASGRIVADSDKAGGMILGIRRPHLWSVSDPYLYTASLSLVDEQGRTLDRLDIPFGIRSIEFSAEKGFLLNGEPVLLKGGCVHHDNGLLGAASYDAAEYRKVRLLKENGFNAVRSSHYPPAEAFLRACDELGLLVIDEAFDQWRRGKNPDDYHLYFDENADSDLESMIRRDRNHSSVIMWSIGNEIPDRSDPEGVRIAAHFRELIHGLDPTRPVTAAVNDYWDNPDKDWKTDSPSAFANLDVCGYNYMWWEYLSDLEKYPSRIIYGSESTAMERARNWDLVTGSNAIIGDFIWTAIDYLGESGIGHYEYLPEDGGRTVQFLDYPWFNGWCGDIDICGDRKPQSLLRDVLWGESAIEMLVHGAVPEGTVEQVSYWGWPNEKALWYGVEGDTLDVRVFTRHPSARLYLNGKLIEEKNTDGIEAVFSLPYSSGELRVAGVVNGEERESCTLLTPSEPEAVKLTADKLKLDSVQDLVYVNIALTGKDGRIAPLNEKRLKFELSGPAVLEAAGNASPVDVGSFRSEQPETFGGRALAIIRATGGAGKVRLKVSAEGCTPTEITIDSTAPEYKGCSSTYESVEPGRNGMSLTQAGEWTDTDGNFINAHGGGILSYGGRYYWYGEYKIGETRLLDRVTSWECWRADAGGVSCYSSDDLVHWKFEGLALPSEPDKPGSDLHPSQVIERPKVIYNDKTGKFVMWMHIESPDYEKAMAGVAVSDSPTGPFTYLGSFKPNGEDSRDQTIFKDDDGRAYQIYSSEWNKTLYIGLLNDEYTAHTGRFTRNFINCSREAPAVFKHGGKYYMITSGCSVWNPNVLQCAVADTMLGHWTVIGDICKGPDAANTYHAQSTFVLPVSGRPYSHIAMFDRWNKTNLTDSRYIWLPVNFNSDGIPEIHWTNSLRLDRPAEGFDKPYVIFNNWSAYDELSDNVPQTGELCLRLLDKAIEMKRSGVQIDCYMMDAFWFDKDGGYRLWHRDNWPDGPGRWLQKCLDNGIEPGLWFSTNLIMSGGDYLVRPVDAWKGSETSDPAVLSLFEGSYLDDLMDVLQTYADMGFKVFKFDFAYFDAATDAAKARLGRDQIVAANVDTFRTALSRFRTMNPEVKFIAYNGYGGDMEDTVRDFRQTVDTGWLGSFDTMYSGDPRFSDVPMMNIWRSADLYSDHMVRQFAFNGVPPARIDDCSVMIGETGTCYGRGTAAWKSSFLLNMARPGRLNVYHGSIDLLSRSDYRWIASAQKLFFPFQESGNIEFIGGIPGRSEVYGYRAWDDKGVVLTLVNPAQEFRRVALDDLAGGRARLLFRDSGYEPELADGAITLGPEQMVVIGCGGYSASRYSMGVEDDVVIPISIEPVDLSTETPAEGEIIRIIAEIKDPAGSNYRTWSPEPMDKVFTISVSDSQGQIPLRLSYDRVIWSGMSWACAEFTARGGSLDLSASADYFGTAVTPQIRTYKVKYNQKQK